MRGRGLAGWVVVGALLAPLACGDMRQDELDCEEAVSHLIECCPGFSGGSVECTYVSGCESGQLPAIDYGQSRCIRGESCATLLRSGVCARAVELHAVTTGQDASPPAAQVCP